MHGSAAVLLSGLCDVTLNSVDSAPLWAVRHCLTADMLQIAVVYRNTSCHCCSLSVSQSAAGSLMDENLSLLSDIVCSPIWSVVVYWICKSLFSIIYVLHKSWCMLYQSATAFPLVVSRRTRIIGIMTLNSAATQPCVKCRVQTYAILQLKCNYWPKKAGLRLTVYSTTKQIV